MSYSPKEATFWEKRDSTPRSRNTDREINERYSRGEGRIVIETNREKIPGFISALSSPNYMDLRPFYQRRSRWDRDKQSLLIESFIMNIPVPPVFLYEKEYNSYEVMDGQQRITALKDFYSDAFALSGLEMWPELNGRNYSTLPEKVRAGLDRRSITSIVVLKESTADEEEASFLRETVFDRLNTGGEDLSRQEIRNALYPSPFNQLLFTISQSNTFRDIWGIPRYSVGELTNPDMVENKLFAQMGDIELVLRLFALRHANKFSKGMQGFLDIYMRKASQFEGEDLIHLENIFTETLDLAVSIFGMKLVFRPYNKKNSEWEPAPHKAFYDAVMVSLSERLDKREKLLAAKDQIVARTKALFEEHEDGTFTGRGNTKKDVTNRIAVFGGMLDEFV